MRFLSGAIGRLEVLAHIVDQPSRVLLQHQRPRVLLGGLQDGDRVRDPLHGVGHKLEVFAWDQDDAPTSLRGGEGTVD